MISTGPDTSNHVLVIAAAFPPTGGPGVQRSSKFCKYLPTFSWQPTVWTVDEYEGLPYDATLLDDLPTNASIVRQPNTNHVKRARNSLQRIGELGGVFSTVSAAMDWRLTRWHQRTAWPDQLITWAKSSVKPLLGLLDEQPFDVIYSTYSPVSNHWLAMELKRRTGLPWVADFRDLWTDDCRYEPPTAACRQADRRLEREFLGQADAVVGVSPSQTAILASHVPGQPEKFFTITNGFDPDDFRRPLTHKCPPSPEMAKFVFAHVGRLAGWRADDALLKGIAAFVSAIGDQRSRFEFRSVGPVGREVERRIHDSNIPFRTTGYVPHGEAVSQMRTADALLLCHPTGHNASTIVSGKLLEYLAAQVPILCVGDDSAEYARIVRSGEAGLVVACEANAINQGLLKLFRAWQAGHPLPGCSAEQLDPYNRVTTTAQLALIFDRLIAKPARTMMPAMEVHIP